MPLVRIVHISLLAFVLACPQLLAGESRPKYIFLMIGDGMGKTQRNLAETYQKAKTGAKKLYMNQLPVEGYATTHPHGGKNRVTDSAAAGTALACGVKTKNGTIGKDHNGRNARAISFDAQAAGMRVGIVTSVQIDHATPASFFANQDNRGQYYEIACQLGKSGFNYFAGEHMNGTGKANGRKLPWAFAKEAGYTSYKEADGLKIRAGQDKVVWEAKLGFRVDAKKETVRLADMTRKGIEVLNNSKGFFMMVEGGKIDWSGHGNATFTNIHETLEFDKAVKVVLDFYERHPKETLIVVTADHETGGLTEVTEADTRHFARIAKSRTMSTGAINAKFQGWKKTKSPEQALLAALEAFCLDLSDAEMTEAKRCIAVDYGKEDSKALKNKYGGKQDLTIRFCRQLTAKRFGVNWTTGGHTGIPVLTTAIGIGSDRFKGNYDNTDIANRIRDLITK